MDLAYKQTLAKYQAGQISKKEWRKFLRKQRNEAYREREKKSVLRNPYYANALVNQEQVVKLNNITKESKVSKRAFANHLRRNMTKAEQCFWNRWQYMRYSGLLPQVVVHGYIADFLAVEQKLIVEIDGSSHDGRQEYDRIRTKHLKQEGYMVVRFTNEEVIGSPGNAVVKVRFAMTVLERRKLDGQKRPSLQVLSNEVAKMFEIYGDKLCA